MSTQDYLTMTCYPAGPGPYDRWEVTTYTGEVLIDGTVFPIDEDKVCAACEAYYHVAVMRAYLRQWIASPYRKGDAVQVLRQAAEQIETAADVTAWIEQAKAEGLDPL